MWALAVSVYCSCSILPPEHTQQRPVTGVRSELCKYTGRGASPKEGTHRGGHQLRGDLAGILDSHSCRGLDQLPGSSILWGRGKGESGGTQVPAVSECKYLWGKTQWNLQRVCNSYASPWFFQWWKPLWSSIEKITRNHSCVHVWLILVIPAFLLCSQLSLYFSVLQIWVGWNGNESFVLCPKRLGKLPLNLLSLSSWRVPSWCRTMPGWRMGWCRQNEAILPSFYVRLFSGFFCSSEVAECSQQLQSFPRAVFVCGQLL